MEPPVDSRCPKSVVQFGPGHHTSLSCKEFRGSRWMGLGAASRSGPKGALRTGLVGGRATEDQRTAAVDAARRGAQELTAGRRIREKWGYPTVRSLVSRGRCQGTEMMPATGRGDV